MKKIFLFLVLCFLYSCSGYIENVTINSAFSIKDLNNKEVQWLEPNLLVAIKKDLSNKGRVNDADRLCELYDFKTGWLKGLNVDQIVLPSLDFVNLVDSTLILPDDSVSDISLRSAYEPLGVLAYAHIQVLGTMGPFLQASSPYASDPNPYVGTVGKGRRLEAYYITTDPSLNSTRPSINYGISYSDGTWSTSYSWGNWVGTIGHSKETRQISMYIPNSGYSIWYKAHNAVVGWQGWECNGSAAGSTSRSLEAFAFHIIKY